jgi:hypothetical protein
MFQKKLTTHTEKANNVEIAKVYTSVKKDAVASPLRWGRLRASEYSLKLDNYVTARRDKLCFFTERYTFSIHKKRLRLS